MILNSLSRPADIYLPSLKRGRPAALDVTVISTMQQATIQGAATTRGHALLVGEARKLAAHADACQAVGISFIPVVFETLGGMCASAVSSLACLGCLLGQRLGIPQPTPPATSFIFNLPFGLALLFVYLLCTPYYIFPIKKNLSGKKNC